MMVGENSKLSLLPRILFLVRLYTPLGSFPLKLVPCSAQASAACEYTVHPELEPFPVKKKDLHGTYQQPPSAFCLQSKH